MKNTNKLEKEKLVSYIKNNREKFKFLNDKYTFDEDYTIEKRIRDFAKDYHEVMNYIKSISEIYYQSKPNQLSQKDIEWVFNCLIFHCYEINYELANDPQETYSILEDIFEAMIDCGVLNENLESKKSQIFNKFKMRHWGMTIVFACEMASKEFEQDENVKPNFGSLAVLENFKELSIYKNRPKTLKKFELDFVEDFKLINQKIFESITGNINEYIQENQYIRDKVEEVILKDKKVNRLNEQAKIWAESNFLKYTDYQSSQMPEFTLEERKEDFKTKVIYEILYIFLYSVYAVLDTSYDKLTLKEWRYLLNLVVGQWDFSFKEEEDSEWREDIEILHDMLEDLGVIPKEILSQKDKYLKTIHYKIFDQYMLSLSIQVFNKLDPNEKLSNKECAKIARQICSIVYNQYPHLYVYSEKVTNISDAKKIGIMDANYIATKIKKT